MEVSGRLAQEFDAITEHWSPRVVALANGHYVKLAKVRGEFVWHAHADEDEFFLVLHGRLVIRFREGREVVLDPGDFHVVPKGVEHQPHAPEEAWIMLVEPAATKHTGDAVTPLTRSVEEQAAHLAR
jgi:mannose-6-phosphate isomerase-like protein (cupin superfamily)